MFSHLILSIHLFFQCIGPSPTEPYHLGLCYNAIIISLNYLENGENKTLDYSSNIPKKKQFLFTKY